MNLSDIDSNFKNQTVTDPDVRWVDVKKSTFSIYGAEWDEKENRYRRVPTDVARGISESLDVLSEMVSGARITFQTDSPYIALKGVLSYTGFTGQTTIFNRYGFAIYDGKRYSGTICPEKVEIPPDGTVAPERGVAYDIPDMVFDGMKPFYNKTGMRKVTIYMPLTCGVSALYIGVKKGSKVRKYQPYKKVDPIVFYGSSITQGCCASRPGLDYIGLLTKWLNVDTYNLGFGGNAFGETAMAEYMASKKASVYVMDYDHNAKTPQQLRDTHYPFYKILRDKHPKTPILFITRPSVEYFQPAEMEERKQIVIETFERAKKEGDNNVWFIDGATLYGKVDRDVCCADTCHPTDIGFYRMAKTIYPVLKEILKGIK